MRLPDFLQKLNDEFSVMTTKKANLEANIALCTKKLERAEKLIGGLGGEKERWGRAAKDLGEKCVTRLCGAILVSSGSSISLCLFTGLPPVQVHQCGGRCVNLLRCGGLPRPLHRGLQAGVHSGMACPLSEEEHPLL